MPDQSLAFIKSGLFSHINASLHHQLATQFPKLQVQEIDIWKDLIGTNRGLYWLSLLQAAFVYPRQLRAQPRERASFALRTPFLFRRIRRMLARELRKRNTEVAFTFQSQSLFDASLPGTPHFVFTDHTHLANLQYPAFRREDLLPRRWTNLEAKIYRNADHVFVMSEHVRASVTQDYGVPPSMVSTVYGGSNVDPTAAPLQNQEYSNRTAVFVGVDWVRKGGQVLAKAFAKVRSELPDARLIVVGCRPGLREPWCEEIGRVSTTEVKAQLLRSSVFCLPTRIEPFGVAVIEAFAHRLPAVVSNVGAMPTLVRHGESGLVVPADDVEALASALRELLADPERCRQFGEAGRRDAEEKFTWDAVGDRLRETIERKRIIKKGVNTLATESYGD